MKRYRFEGAADVLAETPEQARALLEELLRTASYCDGVLLGFDVEPTVLSDRDESVNP